MSSYVLEQLFQGDNDLVYGVVVRDSHHGYKSVLYADTFAACTKYGIATQSAEAATAYASGQFKQGNRVRLKDPRESDGQGQHTVETIEQLLNIFHAIGAESDCGLVVMPHLKKIVHRICAGTIALGNAGIFHYLAGEELTHHNGTEVFGGTTIGVFRDTAPGRQREIEQRLDIPPHLAGLGQTALQAYAHLALIPGRVSVDVVEGITDNGTCIQDVVDITPRVAGTKYLLYVKCTKVRWICVSLPRNCTTTPQCRRPQGQISLTRIHYSLMLKLRR
jgi:hypothetical protein